MAVKLTLSPGHLTINNGSTCLVTDLLGHIAPQSALGLYAEDTRFVSLYELSSNGKPWMRLSSSATSYLAARIYLINKALIDEDGTEVPEKAVSLVLSRVAHNGIHEDLDVTNFAGRRISFNLELKIHSDFADLFEVKSGRFLRRAEVASEWDSAAAELRSSYDKDGFHRAFHYRVLRSGSPARYANGQLLFRIELEPLATWHACCACILVLGSRVRAPASSCPFSLDQVPTTALHRQWIDRAAGLDTSNENLHRLYWQSVEDIGALRLHEHDLKPNVWVPAGGIPWFLTVFGRDSLMVSLQTLPVNSVLARGCLQKLGELQAKDYDDWRDAEPGKIPHELRRGELAHFHRIPHTPYYGTADATPLYLIALHEAWKWTGDDELLSMHGDRALRALEWIDRYGDLDGDGLQEYRCRSPKGIENQSWKDSSGAVVHPDGSPVVAPKALCELQGYVFEARLRMAEVFDRLGEQDRAVDLRRGAAALRRQVEDRFWCEELRYYALALDGHKQRVPTIASNPGHLLWTGLASRERAAHIVRRLFSSDMWSGWGIRTLSAAHAAYNPFGYQRGAVWPHDNGLIALGLKRYGFHAEAAQVARGIIEAASNFVSYRIPELFAGAERKDEDFPVQYPEANIPQGWAAGSVFHLVAALVGLRADAPNGCLYVDPVLPDWLPDVRLRRLAVGRARVDLRIWREGDYTRWEADVPEGRVEIRQESWEPWPITDEPSKLPIDESPAAYSRRR
ncbi:MAG TPA: glycogen debranching N-terminal domain-containing protein [Nitrospira sp.]|nr:glycogen debranching N-terminal domain-containing protein [Nitrospira sp.]